jgi:hypothetical protein
LKGRDHLGDVDIDGDITESYLIEEASEIWKELDLDRVQWWALNLLFIKGTEFLDFSLHFSKESAPWS